MVDVSNQDSSQELSSHDLVRQAFLSGDYASPPLPTHAVDKILDCAEYWKWTECSTKRRVRYRNGRYPYLRLSVPTPEVCKKVKKVEITCVSHDQGWSSYPADRNTYRNSWTWGDVSISRTTPKGVEEIRRERVYTNLHASEEWQVHHCTFGEDSKFVSALVPGEGEVVLYLNAQFPGWENHAKEATIKLMFV